MLKGVSITYLLWYSHSKVFQYVHQQGMCNFHWAFLDDQLSYGLLLGYACCLTGGYWAFKMQMLPNLSLRLVRLMANRGVTY